MRRKVTQRGENVPCMSAGVIKHISYSPCSVPRNCLLGLDNIQTFRFLLCLGASSKRTLQVYLPSVRILRLSRGIGLPLDWLDEILFDLYASGSSLVATQGVKERRYGVTTRLSPTAIFPTGRCSRVAEPESFLLVLHTSPYL